MGRIVFFLVVAAWVLNRFLPPWGDLLFGAAALISLITDIRGRD